ncbi:MAG: phytanoyl-CoA dioxygenase family protein [Verrucomicrobia bacterium]|nr:phytanoyl-CoA dioxygenase family protein [Verrucomicrobiota bacterium]
MDPKAFQDCGFILLKDVIPKHKISSVLSEIKLIEDRLDLTNHNYFYENSLIDQNKKLLRRIEKAADISTVNDLLQSKALFEMLENCTEKKQTLFKDKLNCKLPGGQGFRPHIDGHFYWIDQSGKRRKGWSEYGLDFVSVVIPLEPSTIENGSLQIADKNLTLKHFGKSWDEIANRLSEENGYIQLDDLPLFPMVTVEMFPGDVFIFDWLNAHGSEKNLSQMARRTVFATYLPTVYGNQREHYYTEKLHSQRSVAKKALL